MLVLMRKTGQWITIGENIEVQVVETGTGWAKIGIIAPSEVPILRKEAVKREPGPRQTHGIGYCEQKRHCGGGYLHAEGDNGTYKVDGLLYCERCHEAIDGGKP